MYNFTNLTANLSKLCFYLIKEKFEIISGVEMPFKRSSRCIVFDEDSSSSHGYPRPQDQSTKSEQTSENKQVCDSRLSSLEAGIFVRYS